MTEQEEMVSQLHDWFVEIVKRENPKVYGKVTKVSRSGMHRHIDLFIVIDNEITCLNFEAEQLGIANRDKKDGALRVSGCGMDMIFATWDNLFVKVMGTGWRKMYNIRIEHL